MKCGIITFHRAINFGAVLQTYALNKTIENLGVNCEVIDYYCPFLENHYKPFRIKDLFNIKKMAIIFLKNGYTKDNRINFELFSEKYIKKSLKIYRTHSDLIQCNEEYDTFITGSDQVWSYYCAGFDKAYFLDFVIDRHKKNSYGASFGVSKIPDEYRNKYRELLREFENISVREKQGVEIVKNIIEKNATQVLDPTLLLTKHEWMSITVDNDKKDKYLLVYLLAENKSIIKLAKKIAEEKNIKIIYINDRLFKKSGMNNVGKIDPAKWLSLFLNAEYIVTNSFHGVCFSINFHKEFYMQYLPEPAKVNSRLENILSLFDLSDRCIYNMSTLNLENKVDYTKVEKKLNEERKKSIDFLKTIINYKKV